MIDTHAHIYLKEFREDLDEIIDSCKEAGISKIFMPNIDSTSIDDMLEVERRYPDYCIPMMGLHPGSVDKNFQKELYLVEEWFSKRKFAAVGEVGIDLYWDKTFEEEQKEAFRFQIELAKKYRIPIVIHNREAFEQTYEMVRDHNDSSLSGVFHCFTGNLTEAEKVISKGFYLGIGGVVTYKKGGLDQVLPHIGLNHMVLETDSPYLSPVPFRGKRNTPVYLQYITQRISEINGTSIEELIMATDSNAKSLFNF